MLYDFACLEPAFLDAQIQMFAVTGEVDVELFEHPKIFRPALQHRAR